MKMLRFDVKIIISCAFVGKYFIMLRVVKQHKCKKLIRSTSVYFYTPNIISNPGFALAIDVTTLIPPGICSKRIQLPQKK